MSQGQQVRFNFTMQVGTVATAVEVLADSATALATTTATVGDVLPDTEVRSLPLATRNVIDLAFVTAGTVGENFGGARMSQINTTRDGLPTGDGRYLDWNGAYSGTFTSPDLVEEVQVNVTSVDAAVGRGSGQVRAWPWPRTTSISPDGDSPVCEPTTGAGGSGRSSPGNTG